MLKRFKSFVRFNFPFDVHFYPKYHYVGTQTHTCHTHIHTIHHTYTHKYCLYIPSEI